MKINRRSIAAGLTVGVLAGGAGGAIAAATAGSKVATPSSTTIPRTLGGWDGYGYGWGGYGYRWGGYGYRWDSGRPAGPMTSRDW